MIRAVGVETGGSNIQFAVNPETDEIVVIEMNPRVSRSSALASKATGFPIAKIAARLAVGYALEEIDNDITRGRPPASSRRSTTSSSSGRASRSRSSPAPTGSSRTYMQSVGEAMAIGRTFKQAFVKAMRSRELDVSVEPPADTDELLERLERPVARPLRAALRGVPARRDRGRACTRAPAIDPWFLAEIARARPRRGPRGGARAHVQGGRHLRGRVRGRDALLLLGLGAAGPDGPRTRSAAATAPRVVILGAGPNRIGQGIEFDYCCVHAAMTVRESGRDAVMINCNPETVSTDYDTSDRLYFEPLTLEDVLGVIEVEQPEGVIVQFGGQTPLRLAHGLDGRGRAAARHAGRLDRPGRGPRAASAGCSTSSG